MENTLHLTIFLTRIVPILLLFSASGCATLLGGRTNTLQFDNSPNGEKVEVWLDGEKIGEAPGRLRLPSRRVQHGSVVELRADGIPLDTFRLERRLSTPYFLLDVASTLGVALLVDFGTGHIYRPTPRKFSFNPTSDKP